MSGLRIELPAEALEDLADLIADRLAVRLGSEANPTVNRWMTTTQAAEYLGTTANALHKLTSAREIPFSQDAPGGKCWFKASELDEWRRAKS